ncbi:MAG: hypothetical protein GY730_03365 [bacterium]|nr:hypothetical protein [bacterium]
MNINQKKGFTLLEAIIAFTIIAIIATSFYQALNIALQTWSQGHKALRMAKEQHTTIPVLNSRLKNAKKIIDVSISSNNDGYLQYKDDNDVIITVYKNSLSNRSAFGSNVLFSNENSVVATFHEYSVTSSPELVIDNVSKISFTTYSENPEYIQVASPNNIKYPVNHSEILAVRVIITRTEQGEEYVKHSLIDLKKSTLSEPGTISFGIAHDPENNSYSFKETLPYTGFTTSNTTIESEDPGFPASDEDGSAIIKPEQTVKIRNTGKYFYTIQNAINAAVSGNEILVAKKSGGYTESLYLFPGIKLYGGYENENWSRNTELYETVINVNAGEHDTIFTMENNTSIDGFTLKGINALGYGIKAEDINDFKITNCKFSDSHQAIYISNSTGIIQGNSVSANVNAAFITSSPGSLKIYRNRFYTSNAEKVNIKINNSSNIDFRNNIVVNGKHGLYLDDFSGLIINNIIRNMDAVGIYAASNVAASIYNNAIFHNRLGILSFFGNNVNADYNLVADSGWVHFLGSMNQGSNNITDNNSYIWGQTDPYFQNDYNYKLQGTTAVDNPLIDGGNVSIQDNYYSAEIGNDEVCKGTQRSDTGLNGGPYAGRNGKRELIQIFPSDLTTAIQNKLDSAWPGDFIYFGSGQYNLTAALNFRKDMLISGICADESILSCPSSEAVSLQENCRIENLSLLGNSSSNAIDIDTKNGVSMHDLLIKDFNSAIDINSSSPVHIYNCTLVNNTKGINITGSNSKVYLYRNIITSDTASTGISASNTNQAFLYNTYFNNCSPKISGTGDFYSDPMIDITPTAEIFYDAGNNNYFLHPSSNAIDSIVKTRSTIFGDVITTLNAGCFEYYLVTGSITSPAITTNLYTVYKTLSVKIFDEENIIPDFPPSLNGNHSEVYLSLIFNGRTVTSSPVIPVNSTANIDYTWVLPPSAVFYNLQIRANLRTYRFNRTPFVNQMILTW